MSTLKELMQTLGERIGVEANVKKVFGDPLTVEGRTFIPVASVRYGFGAGSGGPKRESGDSAKEGGGGGGGLNAVPLGVLEIAGDRTRFVRFNPWRPLAIAAAAGILIGVLMARRR